MGIFRRKKNEPQFADRDVVLGHTYEDEALDAAVEAVAEADLTAAVTALAESQTNPDVRSLRVNVLADKLVGKADSVHAAAHEHDHPDLWLLAGTSYIAEAWAVRGDGLARTVGEDRFKMFRATLSKSVQPLHQAARRRTGSGVR